MSSSHDPAANQPIATGPGGPPSPTEQDQDREDSSTGQSLIRRFLSPFSPSALAALPNLKRPARYTRADDIPDIQETETGEMPTVRDYHAINSLPPQVRVPKKVPTPIRVEGKVWFANERTWVSWLNIAVLLATLSLALFNASKDSIARNFAIAYALISVCVLIYGYALYQHRITMIRRRDPGHFDAMAGPIILSVVLFTAILANFIVRVRELQKKDIPLPGPGDFFSLLFSSTTPEPESVLSSLNGTVGQDYGFQKQF